MSGGSVLALLALVAAAATAGGGAARPGTTVRPPGIVVNIGAVLVTAGVLVLVVIFIFQLVAALGEKPPQQSQPKRRWWTWLVTAAVFLGIRFGVVGLNRLFGGRRHASAPNAPVHVNKPVHLPPLSGAPMGVSGPDLLAGVALALIVLVVGYVLVRRSTNALSPVQANDAIRDDLRTPGAELVELSLQALLDEPDPRRAVIAAYQSMDHRLKGAGLGREPWEAPFEHLSRVLQSLGGTAPVAHQLASLFERAKFDKLPCGPEMKQEALAALTLLRQNLASGQPGAAMGSWPATRGPAAGMDEVPAAHAAR